MAPSDLITLQSADIEVGIVPAIGGRVVTLRRTDGDNVLFAPKELWSNWRDTRPDWDAYPTWQPYHGHITWLGPQSGFWNQQDRHPEKRGDNWPPDPAQIYGAFETLARTRTTLELRGPPSPFTGMQLTKRFELAGNEVRLSVIATNCRDQPVSWDLWSNTRVRPDVPSFTPIGGEADIRMVNVEGPPLQWRIENGVFAFEPTNRRTAAKGKAFLTTSHSWIASLHPDSLLVKSFSKTPPDQIHSEQALVEIYLDTGSAEAPGLQELEFHGPFMTLAPGESMTQTETWTLLARSGEKAQSWLEDHHINGWR